MRGGSPVDVDGTKGKAYDSKLMKRLLGYVKPYKKYVVLAIVLNILVSALGPVRPYLTKLAVDDAIANKDYAVLLNIVLILIAVLVFQSFMQYMLTYYTQLMGQKIILDLRVKVFSHIQSLSLKYFDKTPLGRVVTRVTNDVEALNQLFSSGIVMVFSDVFNIIWIFAFMFFLSWKLALVTLSVLPFLFYATFLFRKKVREAYRSERKFLSKLNSFMNEHLTGINIVKLFNKEKDEYEKFVEINSNYKNALVKSVYYFAAFFPVVEFLSSLSIALIIWYGGGKVIQNSITIGVLFAFIQYTEMFFRPIRDLSEKYNIMQTAMAASERIFEVLDDNTIIKNPAVPKHIKKFKGEVEFKNVTFSYNNKETVLKNISFKIEPGQTVAIVGATGAGKTSIINLLTRFYDIQSGEIKVDGINIKEIDKFELRKKIAVVLQDVFLFSGDIKTNINLGNNEITESKIIEAIEMVGADKFINKLPQKINEEVKEKGATLSVGQKQLISFARALAFDPQILILDEATSSVDTETEILIKKAIEKLLAGRTSIVIAHRLSTIQNADRIIVMHKGEIKESDTHQKLLAKKGLYYKLYLLQYKEEEILKKI